MALYGSHMRCRHFNGYKPCAFQKNEMSLSCDSKCPHLDAIKEQVLFIHLGALGAVVRSTALLEGLRRKYPHAKLTWVTDKPAQQLLQGHPLIDQVLTTDLADLLTLKTQKFAVAFVVDKSLKAMGVLAHTQVQKVFGFTSNDMGVILPATDAATELWEIGINDQKKFFQNQKTENQLIFEALELGTYKKEEYHLPLTESEKIMRDQRALEWRKNPEQKIIGLNTGCSQVLPHKKLTVQTHRELILQLQQQGFENIVLLGGPEDTQRNMEIALGLNVISSATTAGLRDGLVSVAACDVVVTGDSLGMHMAIAQKKYVVAWFGPTCAHEIELYGRGVAIESTAPCSPCWKRSCQKPVMCYDLVSVDQITRAVMDGALEREPVFETDSLRTDSLSR